MKGIASRRVITNHGYPCTDSKTCAHGGQTSRMYSDILCMQVIGDLKLLHELLQPNERPLGCQIMLWLATGVLLLLRLTWYSVTMCCCGTQYWEQMRRQQLFKQAPCCCPAYESQIYAPGTPKIVIFVDDLDRCGTLRMPRAI
jgi:hypothetical protein